MRITNQMISNNSLRNMQKTMMNVDNRTTQMETGKKITKASEDPVIAVRALKLRTMVSQLEQYKDKNIGDAESWLKITTTSLDNITKRLEDIQSYCTQGSTDSFNTSDRSAIIDVLKEMQDMINSEGNSTYAGRYIFTGFKTDRSLAFNETDDVSKYSYRITQHMTPDDLDMKTVVLNGVDYTKVDDYIGGTENYVKIDKQQVYRLNLAYEGINQKDSQGNTALSLKAQDAAGNTIDLSGFTQTVKTTKDSATYYQVGPDDINIIEETGEIIFGENVYNTLKQADDIVVDYAKNKFEAGDLRPEHYFDCTQFTEQSDGTTKEVTYDTYEKAQGIYYEVNFSQNIQVNTEGKKIINDDMSNNINDLIYTLQELDAAEKTQTKLKNMLADRQCASNDTAVKQINAMLEDVNVEIAIKKETMQKTFAKNITNFQGYMDEVSAIQSDVGSRMTKLDMIKTRVTEQYSTFKDLKSENEDVSTEEAALNFKEANVVYEAALAATSNLIRASLLDYL